MPRLQLLCALVLLPTILTGATAAQEAREEPVRGSVPKAMSPDEARPALERALAYIVQTQRPEGSWANRGIESNWSSFAGLETYYAWQVASSSLAVLSLAKCEETPERRAALEKGVDWLCATRLPKRSDDWDVDFMWPALYGFVTMVELADDPRFAEGDRAKRIEARGRELLDMLQRNQVPLGGWAYYDNHPYSRRPTWATSFCTALVLPALSRALELGWSEDRRMLERGIEAVRRCALPNGAYMYSVEPVHQITGGEHINDVRGSLGRIQVCNWALARVGDPRTTEDRIREGLELFFRHHRFLDVARMRPIPHEAYYLNAAYFYLFAHFYAAEAIELLPDEAEREAYRARLRPHIVKVQRSGGAVVDFLGTDKFTVAGTAFAALALRRGLIDEEE